MGRQKKQAKLELIALSKDLKDDVSINTISQFITNFKYVENWGNNKTVKQSLPSDSNNVSDFFKSIRKLSNNGFQPQKFHDIWVKHEMEELLDYKLNAIGVITETDEYE